MALLLADCHFPVLGLAVPQFGETMDAKKCWKISPKPSVSIHVDVAKLVLELGIYEV